MRKFLFIVVLVLLVGGLLAGATGVLGYYAHKWQIEPIHSLAERAEAKLRREMGTFKSETELAVEQIETIFLTLRGRVWVMPGQDFQGGGAMTVWGDDLLAMHKTGKIFRLDEDEGLLRLKGLRLPDNGNDAYVAFARERFPDRNARIDALRYNDIEYVADSAAGAGLLLSYTFVDVAEECYRSRLSWLPLDGDAVASGIDVQPGDWNILWQSEPCLAFNEHNEIMVAYMAGGRVAFDGTDTVYFGSGEYYLDGYYRPDVGIQEDDNDYGKVIGIDIATGASRHVSIGHRNLQGVTLDGEGRIWTTEHGMRGGDELNLIRDGFNYGWPEVDMGTLYSGVPANPDAPGRHDEFTRPKYAWVPSAAVSTIALIEDLHPAWDGDLIIGSLKARTIFRARIMDDELITLEPMEIGQRVRDVTIWKPGHLALWLDTGEVVVFTVEAPTDWASIVRENMADTLGAEMANRVGDRLEACFECHAMEDGVQGAGPTLHRFHGRAIASKAFPYYSDALLAEPGDWTTEKLTAYLADPDAAVPGTLMSGQGVGDPDLARAMAETFEWLNGYQRQLRQE